MFFSTDSGWYVEATLHGPAVGIGFAVVTYPSACTFRAALGPLYVCVGRLTGPPKDENLAH